MIVPEVAYSYSQLKDIAAGTFDVIWRRGVGTGGLLHSVEIYEVPGDRVFVLASIYMEGSAASGVDVTDIAINIITDGNAGSPFKFLGGPVEQASATVGPEKTRTSWSGQVWLPPKALVRGNSLFSGSNAGNSSNWTVTGITVPRANVQQA